MSGINSDDLNRFLKAIPDLAAVQKKHADMCAYFAYYLLEIEHRAFVAPRDIQDCYEAADIKPPANVPATMQQSKAFIRFQGKGWRLERQYKESISIAVEPAPPEPDARPQNATPPPPSTSVVKRKVFVVYGRNENLRRALFDFLTSLRLDPIEWDAAVEMTKQGSPYIGEVLKAGFASAQAFVVLFTPDEIATLVPALRKTKAESAPIARPRPNVLLEAGMALVQGEQRTILVQIGNVGEISDIAGRHVLRLNNSPESRQALVTRLKTAGCEVINNGTDWLTAGDFSEADSKGKK